MKRLFLAGVAAVAILASGSASAHGGGVDFNISIGVQGGHHGPQYFPNARYAQRPQVIVVPGPVYQPVPVYRSGSYYNHYDPGPRYHPKYHSKHHRHAKHHHKHKHHHHHRHGR